MIVDPSDLYGAALGEMISTGTASVRQIIGTPSVVTSGNSTADGASVATASITPAVGDFAIVCAGSTGIEPTCTGGGLTWAVVSGSDTPFPSTPARRLTVFRAASGTPSAGALTFTYTGQTIASWTWFVVRIANVASVQQVKTATAAAGVTSIATTFDAAREHPNNMTLVTTAHAGGAPTGDTDFTQTGSTQTASTTTITHAVYFDVGETTCTTTLAGGGNGSGQVMLELKAT